MKELSEVTLVTLGGGLAAELFQHELDRVLADIDNANTSPKLKRKLTLEFTFSPTEDRKNATISVQAKSKLAGVKAAETMIHVGRRGGKLVAFGTDPDQYSMPMDDPQVVEGGKAVADGSH